MKNVRIECHDDMGFLVDSHVIRSHDNGVILKDELIEYIYSIRPVIGDTIKFVEDE